MIDDDKPGYDLVCPFLNQDPVFAQGVAFGMLWVRMGDPEIDEITEYILPDIEEQVRVAACRTGWDVVGLEPWSHDGGETDWVLCRMVRKSK